MSGFPRRRILQKLLLDTLPLQKQDNIMLLFSGSSFYLLTSDGNVRKRPKSWIWRQHPSHPICGKNEWRLCSSFRQRWGKTREKNMYKGTHGTQRGCAEAPGGQVAGPWQAAALENRKWGKSPDRFVKRKQNHAWKVASWVLSGFQNVLSCAGQSVGKLHSESRCLWALTLNAKNRIHFSSFSFVGVCYFLLITSSPSLGCCSPVSVLWNTSTTK